MNQQQSIELFQKGREAWNEWAEAMLREKAELKKAGKWQVREGFSFNTEFDRTKSTIPETQEWLDRAFVDFSSLNFQLAQSSHIKVQEKEAMASVADDAVKSVFISGRQIDFTGFIFPGDAKFIGTIFGDETWFMLATFSGEAWFNEATFKGEAWFAEAKFRGEVRLSETTFQDDACFIDAIFRGNAGFNEAIFAGQALFTGATFRGGAWFSEAELGCFAWFDSATFRGKVEFNDATFRRGGYFNDATFRDGAYLHGATFQGEAWFNRATFRGDAWFNRATFRGDAWFTRATFRGSAYLHGATFQGEARFNGATFRGNAGFNRATFLDETDLSQADFERHGDFSYTEFYKSANFEAIQSKRGFNMAGAAFTTEIPNFNQANFSESPRLDNVKVITMPIYNGPTQKVLGPLKWQRYFWQEKFIPYLCRLLLRLPLKLWQSITCPLSHSIKWVKFSILKFTNHNADKENESRYRALKRLAILSHDHVNEMEFFAGEIRSRRNVKDFWEPISHGPASFLRWSVGVLYELTSDFGRSFSRPFICWAMVLALFSLANLAGTGHQPSTPCQNSTSMNAWQAATTIALKNAVPLLGLTKADNVKRAEACLYGSAPLYGTAPQNQPAIHTSSQPNPRLKTNYQTINPSKQNLAPDVPFKKTILGIGHSILSLIFIFLLLLALRNQFRIK